MSSWSKWAFKGAFYGHVYLLAFMFRELFQIYLKLTLFSKFSFWFIMMLLYFTILILYTCQKPLWFYLNNHRPLLVMPRRIELTLKKLEYLQWNLNYTFCLIFPDRFFNDYVGCSCITAIFHLKHIIEKNNFFLVYGFFFVIFRRNTKSYKSSTNLKSLAPTWQRYPPFISLGLIYLSHI